MTSVASIKTHCSPWRVWRKYTFVGRRWRSFNCYGYRSDDGGRSFSTAPQNETDTYEIQCGASGSITVDVYNAQALASNSVPLIVYLPPYGVHKRGSGPQIPSVLTELPFQAAFARVNYRWNTAFSTDTFQSKDKVQPLSTSFDNQCHSFPTPVHDVAFAYDFLTTELLLNSQAPTTSYPTPPSTPVQKLQRPLILAGSFLGGTLATSLALTSTYANTRNATFYVAGLITQNAPFDWTSVAVATQPSSSEKTQDEQETPHETTKATSSSPLDLTNDQHDWTLQTLHDMRTQLFNNPGSAFDSFASPVLFFHTPGFVVPNRWPGSETVTETDRYSTTLDDDDDLVFEAPDLDIAGDGERGEAELTLSPKIVKSPPTSSPLLSTSQTPAKTKPEYVPEIARTSYLKFPPAVARTQPSYSSIAGSGPLQQQLKIPRSLFLYSTQDLSAEPASKGKRKSPKATGGEKQVSPETQTKEMARLMRRSVLMVESKDRTMWDDSFDAQTVAEDRVKILDVGDAESRDKFNRWLQECLE